MIVADIKNADGTQLECWEGRYFRVKKVEVEWERKEPAIY
jgi:hypothetical protein